MQAKAVYARLGLRRPNFWNGFAAALNCEPLTHATVRRSQGSRNAVLPSPQAIEAYERSIENAGERLLRLVEAES